MLLPDLGVAHQVDVRLHGLLLGHAGELGPVVVLGAGLEGEEAGPVALDVTEGGLLWSSGVGLREVGVEKRERESKRES